MSTLEMLQYPKYKLYARQFEKGARTAAREKSITVVIDVFRASTTMLELLATGARVTPVTTVEEVFTDKYNNYIRVGEDYGQELINFQYDNSPVLISENKPKFIDKNVVIRTTNGTRGIIASIGSLEIIVGTFQNISKVANYCKTKIEQGISVSFVAMGTLETPRIEDDYCANMFVIKVLELLNATSELENLKSTNSNPWLRNWKGEIMDSRGGSSKEKDYLFSLKVDTNDILPIYNPNTQFLECQ